MGILTLSGLDWAIILLYVAVIIGIGLFFGLRVKNSGEFFMANKKLPWWVCSLSFMMVLISAQDIVNYSQTGYDAGFVAYQMYVDDLGWAILFLAIGLPIFFLSGIYSVPEYLERRFGRSARIAGSVATLIFMLALMSFNSYAISVLLNAMFGWDIYVCMVVISIIAAIYTASGGIMSVMITDTLQAVLVFVGGSLLVGAGINMAGGFNNMISFLPTNFRSVFTPMFDPNYPQLGLFFGGGFAITAAWYFAHQGNLQKILSARTLNQSRLVTLVFMGVLMPLGVIFTGTPGIILRSLVEQGLVEAPADSSTAFLILVSQVAQPGVLGLVIAFVMAAMMSTGAGYISSSVTIFVNDIYMQMRPHQKDRHYLLVSRIASVVIAIIMPLIFAGYFMQFDALMTALFSITSAVMPGLVLAVLGGICTKKINSKAATLSILACIVGVMLALFIPDVFQKPFCFGLYGTSGASWFNSLAGLVWAIGGLIVGQIVWRKPEKQDYEYYGLVYFLQPAKKLEELYWAAVKQGKRGYIDLTPEEIRDIVEAEQASPARRQ